MYHDTSAREHLHFSACMRCWQGCSSNKLEASHVAQVLAFLSLNSVSEDDHRLALKVHLELGQSIFQCNLDQLGLKHSVAAVEGAY